MMFASNTPLRSAACMALALIALATIDLVPAEAQAQPDISITPTQLDFGLMQQWQVENAVIVIKNMGDADLNIGEIEITCGCTAAEPVKPRLKPGQTTELAVTFNSQRFKGDTIKYIMIHSDDPDTPSLEVPVHSYVHAALIIEPSWESASFQSVPAGTTKERRLTFSTEDIPVLEVTPARYSRDLFDVRILDSETGNPQEKIISVTVRADAAIGSFREAINFETNVPYREKVHISAAGQVVAPVTIRPDNINFRYLKRDETVSRNVMVSWQKNSPIEVTDVEIDLPGFTIKEIKHSPERNMCEITIEGTPIPVSDERAITTDGRMKGTLRVFTTLNGYPELTASVMYLLKL